MTRRGVPVERVPSTTQKVVVGQIHGFQTNAFIKLRYLYNPTTHAAANAALVNEDPNASGSTNYGSIGGLTNGAPFTYSIAVANRVITIRINGQVLTSFHVQSGWLHVPMYFKAGTYDQASGTSSTDGGRVAFSQLSGWAHATAGADTSSGNAQGMGAGEIGGTNNAFTLMGWRVLL